MTEPKWQRLGVCHVDAGMLLIGDPCYSAYDNHPDHPIHQWGMFCDLLGDDRHGTQLKHPAGHDGLGVVIHTGGDGEWTVDVRLNKYNNVAEIRLRRGSQA